MKRTFASVGERGKKKLGVRGPHKALTKERITIRLSREGWSNFAKAAMAGKRVSMLRCAGGSRSILRRNHHQDW